MTRHKFSYEELSNADTIESGQTSNLKIIDNGYSYWLDRSTLADYFYNFQSEQDTSPTRLVYVWKDGQLVDIYIAPVDDEYDPGREGTRKLLLNREREKAELE
jgi:predicted SnoaL-like aldol condensation-catalyzing enzyme